MRANSYYQNSKTSGTPPMQKIRVRKICSTNNSYENASKQLLSGFKDFGYTTNAIKRQQLIVNRINRNTLLKAKKMTDVCNIENTYFQRFEYHPALMNIQKDVRATLKKIT
ncbi:hypothetical protein GJ496_012001 [Pomphorhynchus laevis]|nr:hypothetical protein GJ496_012001 [Pomphorhynchus laevis]